MKVRTTEAGKCCCLITFSWYSGIAKAEMETYLRNKKKPDNANAAAVKMNLASWTGGMQRSCEMAISQSRQGKVNVTAYSDDIPNEHSIAVKSNHVGW